MSDPPTRPSTNPFIELPAVDNGDPETGDNQTNNNDLAPNTAEMDDPDPNAVVDQDPNIAVDPDPPAAIVPDQSRIDSGNRLIWAGRVASALPSLAHIGLGVFAAFGNHIPAAIPFAIGFSGWLICSLILGQTLSREGTLRAESEIIAPAFDAIQEQHGRVAASDYASRALNIAASTENHVHHRISLSLNAIPALIVCAYVVRHNDNT